MIRNTRNSHIFRGVALALLAFYGIATGRSLIPGLCASLAAAEGRANAESTHSCCNSVPLSSKTISVAPETYATCALCNLTESVSNTNVYSYEVPAQLVVDSVDALLMKTPVLPTVWTPAALRAPPVYA